MLGSERTTLEFFRAVAFFEQKNLVCTSDFQSEVGEVFGELGGELPAKFGRRFSSFFCWENRQKHFPPKLHRKFHHQTSLRGSGLWRALKLGLNFYRVRNYFQEAPRHLGPRIRCARHFIRWQFLPHWYFPLRRHSQQRS